MSSPQTFWIQTLGCKVNSYESEQIATFLRGRGLSQVERASEADLRVINTCSVTIQAASKSRQTIRRAVRLPVLSDQAQQARGFNRGSRTLVMGCWATSDPDEARALSDVDAVLGHHDDIAKELDRLLDQWCVTSNVARQAPSASTEQILKPSSPPTEPIRNDVSMILAGAPSNDLDTDNKPRAKANVKKNSDGTHRLPLLGERYTGHQRAFLKIQDGCDAHCTYCIIPQLRPTLWSKPVDDAVEEATRLVEAGHVELVLTGVFLGAYGHETALRRRQTPKAAQSEAPDGIPLAKLIDALCTRIPGLKRLRLSSLEPGDLTPDLVSVLKSHAEIVPHFHLPLQSGSDAILHKMNRQYTRDDFLRMLELVHGSFDRPALTTDIIVGFPGETDDEFAQTLDLVDRARFIHTHAFSYSPRPKTAAARWTDEYIHGPVVNQRIELLNARAQQHSFEFRRQFLGETMELLVEQPFVASASADRLFEAQTNNRSAEANPTESDMLIQHGRCERYFDVHFEHPEPLAGQSVCVVVERVTPQRTHARLA
ncbi:MAG TPA: MiaB/RimO family radical SAM methylthiotransferase [Tepidisphaeraceae bacterium]|nr:MiaB/RimO family radical SAM methylthiotransferase [Tepidisphaeraceae bacterium]